MKPTGLLFTHEYAFNNPMLFIDPDGRDNIVYLYAADNSVTRKQLNAIARQATANYKEMGLKTQVKVFKGKFDKTAYGKLDKTDGVAVIGKSKNVVKAVEGFNQEFGTTLKSAGFGNTDGSPDPEYSQNVRYGGTGTEENNIVAIGTEATQSFSEAAKATFEVGAAFLINHGTGHNSNIEHAGTDNGYNEEGKSMKIYVPGTPNVMTDGRVIINNIRARKSETLQTYIKSPINQQPAGNTPSGTPTLSIKSMYIYRFGNNTPKANLPTQ